jgi:DNA-binding response OmpR family regulator
MEIVDQTIKKDPRLSETLTEHDSPTSAESTSHSILVVDDDKNLANTFKLILETVGYNVDTAFTGLQALYKINRKTYGLVLLDLNLPDIMGDEVAEEIEELSRQTDIVFITGHEMLKSEVETQLDMKEVLMKPIAPEDLLKTTIKRLESINTS